MTFFSEIQTKDELRTTYKKLSLINHPDKGGSVEVMQKINFEYSLIKKTFGIVPEILEKAQIGNFIFVNKSSCIITGIDDKLIKAKSLTTKREALFDKKTGYGIFNLKFKAHVNGN